MKTMDERQREVDAAWARYERRQVERERFETPQPEPAPEPVTKESDK
jgi:hypothetical protein